MPDYREVGDDVADNSQTPKHERRAADVIVELLETANARQQAAYKDDVADCVHIEKVREQYHRIRLCVSVLAIAIPPLLLMIVMTGVMLGWVEKLQPVAQAMLISGPFVSFIALYGVILHNVYKTQRQNMSATEKNAGGDFGDKYTMKDMGIIYLLTPN